eukprot:TRINITY_DN40196_c0_g1_i1.p1 TRINITY_DN40196_c0_g1~~TRINITY_DN40196_c0_g1_i1.p1  ORF type:complete len:1688 (-),score=308.77 TRINITY_DN40196_c0_g1_i1:309-5372(-)
MPPLADDDTGGGAAVTVLPPLRGHGDGRATPRLPQASLSSRFEQPAQRVSNKANATISVRKSPSSRPVSGGEQKTQPALDASLIREKTGELRCERLSFDAVDSKALRAVQTWWAPVEASVMARNAERLTTAVKVAHGGDYLKTVKIVRRSTSLRPVERNELEMEMAARLVRARAVLAKWAAGLREVQAARKARDIDKLEEVLTRWGFAEEDPEIVSARQDLHQWRSVAATLPILLEEAMRLKDVAKLKEGIGKVHGSGPATVKGLELARKVVGRYQRETKRLHEAVRSGNAEQIEAKLLCWRFHGDDHTVHDARQTLQERENLKAKLKAACEELDGPLMQQLVDCWRFETTDEDFKQAQVILVRHTTMSATLRRAIQRQDLPELAKSLSSWDFARNEPFVHEAEKLLLRHAATVRDALTASDAWTLRRLWVVGGCGRALDFVSDGSKEEVIETLQKYDEAVALLRQQVETTDSGETAPEFSLETLTETWPFVQDDPNLWATVSKIKSRCDARTRAMNAVNAAVESGSVEAVSHAVDRVKRIGIGQVEGAVVVVAERLCSCHELALQAVGTLAFGVAPEQLREAAMRARVLDEAAHRVHEAAEAIPVTSLVDMRSVMHAPNRVIHGLMEICMHFVAGICPGVKDPPRDAHWRSVQHMLANIHAFFGSLFRITDWLASGNRACIGRARKVMLRLEAEEDEAFSAQGNCQRASWSRVAEHLYAYIDSVFAYADLVENAEQRAETLASGTVPAGESGRDAWGRSMTPTPLNSRPGSRAACGGGQTVSPFELQSCLWAEGGGGRPPLASPSTIAALCRAQRTVCSSPLLLSAWAIMGLNTSDLEGCLENSLRHWRSAQATSIIANVVLRSLALTQPTTASDTAAELADTKGSTDTSCAAPFQQDSPRTFDGLTLNQSSESTVKQEDYGYANVSQTSPILVCAEDVSAPEQDRPPTMPVRALFALHAASPSAALHCAATKDWSPWSTRAKLSLTIRLMSGVHVADLILETSATGADIKAQLARIDGTPFEHQKLFYRSEVILDDFPLVTQRVTQGATVFLLRMTRSLPVLLETALKRVASSCSAAELEALGPSGRPVGEPAMMLLYGASKPHGEFHTPPTVSRGAAPSQGSLPIPARQARKVNLQASMLDVLRAANDAIRNIDEAQSQEATDVACLGSTGDDTVGGTLVTAATVAASPTKATRARTSSQKVKRHLVDVTRKVILQQEVSSTMQRGVGTHGMTIAKHQSTEQQKLENEVEFEVNPVELTGDFVSSLRVPQLNLAAARHSLCRAGDGGDRTAAAVADFVMAIVSFYDDFVPQKMHRDFSITASEKNESMHHHVEAALVVAEKLSKIDQVPAHLDANGVSAMASDAATQVETLAKHGLALPAIHVESVRQAVDSAGSCLLSKPPAANPEARLHWAERAMSIQLAPLPPFSRSLREIASSVDCVALQELAHETVPTSVEVVRLFGALVWVVDPNCKCDANWTDARELLADTEAFVKMLVDWSPVRDGSPARLARARELMLGSWLWAAVGCNKRRVLSVIFAWVSFVVVLLPMIEMAQRLIPAQKAVKKGLAKIMKAPPEHAEMIKERAWTSALFLLDSRDEPWWWLQFIRPTAQMEPPWMDGEDGGLSASRFVSSAAVDRLQEASMEEETSRSSAQMEEVNLEAIGDTDLGPEDGVQPYMAKEMSCR